MTGGVDSAIVRKDLTEFRACRFFVVIAALMLGAHEVLPLEVVWGFGVLAVLGAGAALFYGVTRFRWPSRAEAMVRLDDTLPGRPITAVSDIQAVGSGDAASEAVWQAHVRRMEERLAKAKAAPPDLRLSSRDPYALRYVAAVALVMALLFGSIFRAATVTDVAGGSGGPLASGPAWEGWVEPPLHTGRPSLYLNDIERASFSAPDGSRVTIRLYGEVGALSVTETVSGRTGELPPATEPTQSFDITQAGEIEIDGRRPDWDSPSITLPAFFVLGLGAGAPQAASTAAAARPRAAATTCT